MSIDIPEIIEKLLKEASAQGASDIHLIADEPPVMRIDGVLHRSESALLSADDIQKIAAAVIGQDNLDRIGGETGEAHRSLHLPEEVNALISVARAGGDFTIAIRMFVSHAAKPEELGVPEAMIKAAESPNGLVVVSGVVGCGKLTVATSLVEHLNINHHPLICTVEDPIIVNLTPKNAIIRQREVGLDVPDTVSGISAALKQDADVIFVSEIKNMEELQACISAAENGHLVIIVLYASTPEHAVRKMMDLFPEDIRKASLAALANSLRGVSVQYLWPRMDKPGRVAAFGVLIPDDEMRDVIVRGGDFMARTTPMPEGCQTLEEDLERLQRESVISPDTLQRALGNRYLSINRCLKGKVK